MYNKNQKISLILMVLLTALTVAAVVIYVCDIKISRPASSKKDGSVQSQSQVGKKQIDYNGKTYEYNSNLINVLFLGIDKADDIDKTYMPGEAGQADCIMILSLDETTKEANIWQINRNAMTEVDLYDISGNAYKTIKKQLATQYAYCVGGSRSCFATEETVAKMLYDLPIDGYVSLSVEGISEINDALGGVTVTMTEADELVDPSFKAGADVLLKGDLAETYVRRRDINVFDSVSDRMRRQTTYITALISQMKNKSGSSLYDTLSPFLDNYILTDLDAKELEALKNYQYKTDDIHYLPGETTMGEKYEEFNIDETSLQEMLIDNFYTEVDDAE